MYDPRAQDILSVSWEAAAKPEARVCQDMDTQEQVASEAVGSWWKEVGDMEGTA